MSHNRVKESVLYRDIRRCIQACGISLKDERALPGRPKRPCGACSYRLDSKLSPIAITSRATDLAGNVSPESGPFITALQPDNVPSVVVLSPSPGALTIPNSVLSFEVEATDDVGIAEITVAAFGAGTLLETRTFSSLPATVNSVFDIELSVGTTSGLLTFSVVAVDTAGQASAPG